MHLVGKSSRRRGDDRTPVRHRFERHERAALVERRVDEQVGRLVPGVQVLVGVRPMSRTRSVRPSAAICCSSGGRHGPSPTITQNQDRLLQRRQRLGEHVEPLVLFEAADAQQDDVRSGRHEPPHVMAVGRAGQRLARLEVDGVRNRHQPRRRRLRGSARTDGSIDRSVAMTADAARRRTRGPPSAAARSPPPSANSRRTDDPCRRTPRAPAGSAPAALSPEPTGAASA